MVNKQALLVILTVFLMMLSACSKNTAEPVNEKVDPPAEEEPEQAKEEEPEELPFEFPLTGVKTSKETDQRAISVMINNHPSARQQTGLSKADIVYEVLAEGVTTRFLAIYQSEFPENIGPVRSARDYYINLAQGYESLYIAHGYSPEAHQMLFSGKYDQLNGMQHDGTLFKRANFRKAPHNSYITFENIVKGSETKNFDLSGPPKSLEFLTEEEMAKLTGDAGNYMKVSYDRGSQFTVEYKYDATTGKYARYSGGVQTVEHETKEPVLMENIIVIETSHQVIDAEGRNKINLTSGGNAYVVQKGIKKEVEWKNNEGRLLPYERGLPVKLVPGKTWINIVPALTSVSFEE